MKLKCIRYNGTLVAAVQHGTYMLRCPWCQGNYNSTSWCAAGPTITERVAFYREGATKTPEKRIASLQTANPHKLALLGCVSRNRGGRSRTPRPIPRA